MSQRNSGYDRRERELYETPAWVTECLLRHLPVTECIWEPACGSGKMVAALKAGGRKFFASDIVNGDNFLERWSEPRGCDAIVTNPPFELATEFIEHALELMVPVRGLVAMLLRIDFDSAKTRKYLFKECPAFAKKIVLTRRIRWFEGTDGNPSYNHAWFMWDLSKGVFEPPTLAYEP